MASLWTICFMVGAQGLASPFEEILVPAAWPDIFGGKTLTSSLTVDEYSKPYYPELEMNMTYRLTQQFVDMKNKIKHEVLLTDPSYNRVLFWFHGGNNEPCVRKQFMQAFAAGLPQTKLVLAHGAMTQVTIWANSSFHIHKIGNKPIVGDSNVWASPIWYPEDVLASESWNALGVMTSHFLKDFVYPEVDQVGDRNVFLVGFSEGCAFALHLSLRSRYSLGGVVAFDGMTQGLQVKDAGHSCREKIPVVFFASSPTSYSTIIDQFSNVSNCYDFQALNMEADGIGHKPMTWYLPPLRAWLQAPYDAKPELFPLLPSKPRITSSSGDIILSQDHPKFDLNVFMSWGVPDDIEHAWWDKNMRGVPGLSNWTEFTLGQMESLGPHDLNGIARAINVKSVVLLEQPSYSSMSLDPDVLSQTIEKVNRTSNVLFVGSGIGASLALAVAANVNNVVGVAAVASRANLYEAARHLPRRMGNISSSVLLLMQPGIDDPVPEAIQTSFSPTLFNSPADNGYCASDWIGNLSSVPIDPMCRGIVTHLPPTTQFGADGLSELQYQRIAQFVDILANERGFVNDGLNPGRGHAERSTVLI